MKSSGGMEEFKLGTKPLIAALLGTMCGASPIPYNVLPLVIGPIHSEFGWDFKTISLGITIFGLISAPLAPFVGMICDKIGVRKVALTSLVLFALVFASFYFVSSNVSSWFILWALLGLIGIGSTPVSWSRAVSMWFVANRGLALGIMLIGTSLAGILVPQIAKQVIANEGWRMAFPALALLPLLIALPIGLFWFREPKPDEIPSEIKSQHGDVWGLSFADALKNYRFYILIISVFIVSTAYGGIHIHMAQIVSLHGFASAAASTMGILALGILSGRVIVGALFDRFWAPLVAFLALLLPAMACFLLMGTATPLHLLQIGAFLVGFTAGTESDVVAFFVAKYFGMKNYGKIYGSMYTAFGLGAAISPLIYGVARDATGNYDAILKVAIAMFAAGATMLLFLGKYPKREEQ